MTLLTRALPATLDVATGTVECVLSTGAMVKRTGYREVLALGPEAITLAAPNIPLLDCHRQTSIRDVLGTVTGIRHEPGQLVATVRLTDENARAMVQAGVLTGVSIGYRVTQWAEHRDAAGLIRTAVRWTLCEASVVPVPADPGCSFRGDPTMPTETETTCEPDELAQRAAVNTAIRAAVNAAGLAPAFGDDLVDRGASLETARSEAFQALIARGAVTLRTQQVAPSNDDPGVMVPRMAEALTCRETGTAPSEPARQYMSATPLACARMLLAARGERVLSLGTEALLTRAMTTSDFPNLLLGVGNRTLMASYTATASPLKAVARQATISDFRARSLLRLGEISALLPVTESGEVKSVTVGEGATSYSLSTYAAIVSLTRAALINDDLGAFSQTTAALGQAAAQTEAAALIALLTQGSGLGPLMNDGKRLFHTAHGNLAGGTVSPNIASLTATRLAMRMQTGLDNVTPVNVVPRYILVPAALESAVEQLLTSINPTALSDVNIFAGKLTLLVEPRLTTNSWYVLADPGAVPVIEYAYLSGASGPQLSQRDGFETLGRDFRCVLDFGCGVLDWRGIYKNPGP